MTYTYVYIEMQKDENPYIEIDWDAPFNPLYGSVIEIPSNVILWRGYDTKYPNIPDRPCHYSSKSVASGYIMNEATHKLGCFMTTYPLRIIDIRFLKIILSKIIQSNMSDKYFGDFVPLMISFGLCSLRHQIALMEKRYTTGLKSDSDTYNGIKEVVQKMKQLYNPDSLFEQHGIRVAEPINDGITMAFLRELFRYTIDGFFSPGISFDSTSENIGAVSPEIVLFSPKNASIVHVDKYPAPVVLHGVHYVSAKVAGQTIKCIHEFISKDIIFSTLQIDMIHADNSDIGLYIYQTGNGYKIHPLDRYNELFYRKNVQIMKYDKLYTEIGRKWNTWAKIYILERPAPCMPVSNFFIPKSEENEIYIPSKYEI